MREKKYKRCPRCDKRALINDDKCENCGLIFSRLKFATNISARENIFKKQHNKVIMDKNLPRDVNKWDLFWRAVLFGWCGLQYKRVGRYKMFAWSLVALGSLLFSLFFMKWYYQDYLFLIVGSLTLIGSFYEIFAVVSIFQILFNSFKVPISIDEELVKEKLDKRIVEDILNQVEHDKKEIKKDKDKSIKVKYKKISIICKNCGQKVKVKENEKICPKCDEDLYE